MHERLPKFLALPVFSSDAVSSVAYGPQEVLVSLAVVGAAVWDHSLPIGIAITVLIAIVVFSYRRTIHAYPQGGGSYIVTRDNLGTKAGLVAAASILTDYVLTVAVSMAAGIQAIVALMPDWAPYTVHLCIAAVLVVALGNLRGVRESGLLFAGPTYVFIGCLYVLVIAGLFKLWVLRVPAQPIVPFDFNMPIIEPLGVFVVLRAFSNGCSALTGIEAIADGVPAFRPPESKNAASTMTFMAVILGSLVLGITYLGHVYHGLPWDFLSEHPERFSHLPGLESLRGQTLVAQLVTHIFGRGPFFTVTQVATCAILILAANTAFQDFPRLSSILARHRFAPRQLANLGDRLAFNNGILILSVLSILLLIAFQGRTTRLIPLYAIGVFISFTLSQLGMAVRQRRLKESNWRIWSSVSLVGACATGFVAVIIGWTKAQQGAWIAMLLIIAIVAILRRINRHYISLGDQLRLIEPDEEKPVKTTSIVLTGGIHKGIVPALRYAKSLSTDCRALYIETDPTETPLVRERWEKFGLGVPLVILESQYRTMLEPVEKYLEEAKKERPDHLITVVVPEFVPRQWWHQILHNQNGIRLKLKLMGMKDIVVTNVRYYLER